MASKTSVELIDDLTGETADESVRFGLDGVEYLIDLSATNAQELRDRLSVFVEGARRVKGSKGVRTAAEKRKGLGREQNQAIREWARAQGEKVNERGRIPAELVVRFQEAHTAEPQPDLVDA